MKPSEPTTTPPGRVARVLVAGRQRAAAAWFGPSGPDLRLGLWGILLMLIGGPGAAAHLRRDPITERFGLSWIQYGHGVIVMTLIVWIGIALLAFAWLRMGLRVLAGDQEPSEMSATAVLWAVALIPSNPLFSRDVYSYLGQGALTRAGISPYTHGPIANARDAGPLLIEISGDWRNTTTPYGPLHLQLMRGVVTLSENNVIIGMLVVRLLMLAGFLAILWAVPRIADALGTDPGTTLWLGPLNPLVLLHLVGGIHNEALMLGFMCVGLFLVLRDHPLPGIALIAAGASVKATAAVALPFAVWLWMGRLRAADGAGTGARAESLRFLRTAVPGAIVALGVITALEFTSDSPFGWIEALGGSDKVVNLLSVPTVAAHLATWTSLLFSPTPFTLILAWTRLVGTVLMVTGLLVAVIIGRRGGTAAIRGLCLAFLAVILFNALALPWYHAWILVIIGAADPPRRLIPPIAAASLWLLAMFAPNGATNIYTLGWLAAGGLVAWATLRYMRRGTSAEGASTDDTTSPVGA